MKSTRLSCIFRRRFVLLALIAFIVSSAFSSDASAKKPRQNSAPKTATVFQFSTLPALALGNYDGEMTFGELLKHGDFGVGTFDTLDGELIILDGKAWRVRADGVVSGVDKNETTPFAAVTRFAPDQTQSVAQPIEYSMLLTRIGAMLKTPNLPHAIRVRGVFSRLKVRSVPRQNKPYRALSEVVKTQSVFEWKNLRGTLVGFRFPPYLSGVNLADYHFHFVSDDKKRGGHVLDGALQSGTIEIQSLRGFAMQLPQNAAFDNANLNADQSASLKAAEANTQANVEAGAK